MAICHIVVKSSTVVDEEVGWGAIIRTPKGYVWELAGPIPFEEERTVMRSTLAGIVAALSALPKPATVCVSTDIQYIADGFRDSLDKWVRRGWKRKGPKHVTHRDLWTQILQERNRHRLSIVWKKLGDEGKRAAELAAIAREGERVYIRHELQPENQ
jgi:ribonuclease HI